MAQYPVTEHEYTLNNGSTWQTCTAPMDNGDGTATITVGDVAIAVGHLKVRVKASGSRPAGLTLSNTVAFTQDVVTPPPSGGSTPSEITAVYHTLSGRPAPELTPLQAFAEALETAGVYDKMVAGYILNGGSEAANKYNIFDPEDSNDAFRALFTGTVTHQADGVLFAGGSGVMDTLVNYPSIHGAPDIGVSIYTKELQTGSIVGDSDYLTLYYFDSDGKAYPLIGDDGFAGVTVTGGNKKGFKTAQRLGTALQVFHSGAKVAEGTNTAVASSAAASTIKLHYGYPDAPVAADMHFSLMVIHMSLTEVEQTAFFNAVETLMTAFSINVTP